MQNTAQLFAPTIAGYTGEQLRAAAVYLTFAISFIVFVEPAPVDVMFLVLFLCFWRSGLSVTIGAATLTLLLILYNLGGFFAAIPVISEPKVITFVVTSTYMGFTAIFLAYYIAHDPLKRINYVRLGWIAGACFASILGLLDYLGFEGPFLNQDFVGRATGSFKDPNVFSTYLIFPALILMQSLMLGSAKRQFLSVLGAALIISGVFFSFSRGAWANFVLAFILMIALTFIVQSNSRTKQRIVLISVTAFVIAALAFMLLMSIEPVREFFFERFKLVQNYDGGETGRFGNQLRAIPELMSLPLGYGPRQFYAHFNLDPHNTFINAFASYGWLGGISYFVLFVSTIIVGFRSCFTKSPWQNYSIAVFCPLLTTLLQGVQIDMDHWRHLYWLVGLNWGLYAATLQPALVVKGLRH